MFDSIRAYPLKDHKGYYNIIGKNTYHYRQKIREAGGRWNSTCWVGPIEAVKACNADVMMRVRVAAHCHESEQEIWVTEREVKAGVTDRMGCGWCDTSYLCGDNVKILEVINNEDY